jgi:hypothetical protein
MNKWKRVPRNATIIKIVFCTVEKIRASAAPNQAVFHPDTN